MSTLFTSLFRKIVISLIVIVMLLPLLITLFGFISKVFAIMPTFARYYTSLGLGVFVFKIVKGWLAD